MSEFKGTKGNWTVLSNAKYSDVVKIKSDLGNPTFGENEANALLISKAPEMLEMLQWFVENFEGVFHEGTETDNKVKEAKQLIKQATKL